MPIRRESGRPVLRRRRRRPEPAPANPPAYRVRNPVIDAPQARQRDTQRAESFKRTPAYQRDLKAAREAKQRQYEAKQRARAPRQAAQQRVQLQAREHPSLLTRVLRGAARGVEELPTVGPVTKLLEAEKPKAVERELRGEGVAAKALKRAADFTTKNTFAVETGGGPAGVLTKRSTEKARREGRGAPLAAATPTRVELPTGAKRTLADFLNLPATAIPSMYVPASAATKAARGDTTELRSFLKTVKETDPVYNAVTGNFKKALHLAEEHPGFTAVELLGAKGTVGRGAGRAVRGTGRVVEKVAPVTGGRIRRVAATDTRPNATLPGTGREELRSYSRDLTAKARQKGTDAFQARRARKLRAKADRLQEFAPEEAQAARTRAAAVDPTIMSKRAIRTSDDMMEAAGETRRRREIHEIREHAEDIVKKSHEKGGALNLVAQGITKATVEDLRAYRDQLAAEYPRLGSAKQAQNAQARKLINLSIKRAESGRIRKFDLDRVKAAAQRYSREIDQPLDRELAELKVLPKERGERAKLIPAAARRGAREEPAHWEDHDGNPVSEAEVRDIRERHGDAAVRSLIKRVPARIVDAEGRRLSNARMRAMRADPDVEPSYLSQGPNARGARNYYTSSAREPVIATKSRTGQATREGTLDVHPETLPARAVRGKGLAIGAQNYRERIGHWAYREQGKAKSFDHATASAKAADLYAETGVKWRPVLVDPWGVTREQRVAMREAMDAVDTPAAQKAVHQSMQEALDPRSDLAQHPNGRFMLIPETAARNMQAHLKHSQPGDLEALLQKGRGSFSGTVLSLSPSPLAGNIAESGVRLGLRRAGPTAYLTQRRLRKEMGRTAPQELERLEDRLFTGGRVALSTKARHLDPQTLDSDGARQVVAGMGAALRVRGVRQVVAAWGGWRNLMNNFVNGKIERGSQAVLFGKFLRDEGIMDTGIIRTTDRAVQQAARRMTGTAEQEAAARYAIRGYGQYDGLSPNRRWLIGQYTPFLAWTINSTNFLRRLPFDFPTLTLLNTINVRATEDWRRLMGLDIDMGGTAKGQLPGWKQGTLPVGKESLQVTKHTPLGVATDPAELLGGLWMPQLSSSLKALQGMDWKNTPLRHEDGSEFTSYERMIEAVRVMMEGSVPAYAVPERVIQYVKDPGKFANPARIKGPTKSPQTGLPLRPSSRKLKPIPSASSSPSEPGDVFVPEQSVGGEEPFVPVP